MRWSEKFWMRFAQAITLSAAVLLVGATACALLGMITFRNGVLVSLIGYLLVAIMVSLATAEHVTPGAVVLRGRRRPPLSDQ